MCAACVFFLSVKSALSSVELRRLLKLIVLIKSNEEQLKEINHLNSLGLFIIEPMLSI